MIVIVEHQLVDSIGFLGAKFQSGRPAGPNTQVLKITKQKVRLLFHICTSLELFLLFLAGLKSPISHKLSHSLETDS